MTLLFTKTVDEKQAVDCHEDYVIVRDEFEGTDVYLSYEAAQSLSDAVFLAQRILSDNENAMEERYLEGTDMDPDYRKDQG